MRSTPARTSPFEAVVTDSSGQETTSEPVTVSVADEPIRPTLTFGKVVRSTTAGTATLPAAVNTSGTLTLTGAKVVTTTRKASQASTVKLGVKVKPAYRSTLVKKGKLSVTVKVTFRDSSGASVSRTKTLVLVKKKR